MATVSSNTKVPIAEGYELRVNTKYYRLAASPAHPLTIGSRDSLAERMDDRGSPAENVLDIGYAWARTDFSGGEGFDWDPPEIPTTSALASENPRKYWDSENVDISRSVAGNKYELKLSPAFEEWNSALTPMICLTASSLFFYVIDGDTVRWYDTFDNTVEEGSDTPVISTDILKIVATPDDRVVVMLANGDLWGKPAGSGTFALIYNSTTVPLHGDVNNLWYAKGRFLAQDEEDLMEVLFDGSTPISIEIVPDDLTIRSVVESGPAIVAAYSDGTIRTYNTTSDAGVTILEPASRIDMPKGEVPYLLGSNAGRLLILTAAEDGAGTRTIRLYQAEVLDERFDYIVGDIQLRREWFGTTEVNNIASNIFNTRDSMVFPLDEAGGSAIWTYDLVTQGLSRLARPFTSGETHALIEFDGRIALVSTSTDTIYAASATKFVPEGWLITPNISFGLNTDIAWIATVLEAANLAFGGVKVELYYSTDPEAILDHEHSSWVLHHRLLSQNASGLQVEFTGVKARTLALQLRLFSSSSNLRSPLVSRTAVRGIPAHRDRIVIAPINVSDIISAPGRRPVRVPNYGIEIQKELQFLVGENVEFELLRMRSSFKGIINNVSEPITLYSDRGSPTTIMNIEFRGSLARPNEVTGSAGIGFAQIGFASIGLGDEDAYPDRSPTRFE
jgi:hypothetical protein